MRGWPFFPTMYKSDWDEMLHRTDIKRNKIEGKFKIVVAINSLVSTKHIAYSNHIQLMFRFGRNYPNIDFCLVNPARMSIDRFRNMAAEVALSIEARYLLFLDDDVLVPFDCLDKLIKLDTDIAAGDVIIRGYPFQHMLFQYTDKTKRGLKPIKKLNGKRGRLNGLGAVGCSLTLIKTSLIKQLPKPYFVTGPETNTEDIYFCVKAKQVVSSCTIAADTSIVCSHILWEEVIDSINKDNYKKYYEAQYPELKRKPPRGGDRGNEYLTEMKAMFTNTTKGDQW